MTNLLVWAILILGLVVASLTGAAISLFIIYAIDSIKQVRKQRERTTNGH